ncbi:MAG: asparagine--tRNA ligase [Candidatus Micrarchaeia archaeon]
MKKIVTKNFGLGENGKTTYIKDLLNDKMVGKKVTLFAWVWRKREHANDVFLVMRDSTGVMQAVVPSEKLKDSIYLEASVSVSGTVTKDERAPGGYEIHAEDVKIIGNAKDYPISKDFSEEFLLDVRHLWNRSTKMKNIMLVRERILEGARNWFASQEWHEVNPPILTGSATEGGSTLFKLDYYGKNAYLSQSAQLYLETLIFSLEKVWSLTPSFRAEKSRTNRHLMEFWHLEGEAAWLPFEGILKVEEELVTAIVHHVAETVPNELKALDRDPEDLFKIKAPFKRVPYDEAIKILNKKGSKMQHGEDLSTEDEKLLCIEEKSPIFVVGYPKAVKPFYAKIDPNHSDMVLSADMLAPEGYGEISTGGQREEDLDAIVARIKAEGFTPESYAWYLDLRKFGSVPHSGWGLGIDRVTKWITKRDTILDTIPYPRTLARIYP